MKLLISRIESAIQDIKAIEEVDPEAALINARLVLNNLDEILSKYPQDELQKARDLQGQKAVDRFLSYQ